MRMNESVKLANLRMLQFAAKQLGILRDDVVFLGGCTTALFITDTASPDVRYTLDVDCIVDVISLSQYYQFEKGLIKQGFKKSIEDDVICRWRYDDVILDVMPTDEKILGFGNRWYKAAIQSSKQYVFSDGFHINVVSAPYFLATKLEAFKTRGNMDFLASHDFEDIVSVIDGRVELIKEIEQSDHLLREYLANSFHAISNNRSFHDALPGHFVPHGSLAGQRIDLMVQKVEQITQCVEV
jgi:hypothetical protein